MPDRLANFFEIPPNIPENFARRIPKNKMKGKNK